MQNEINLKSLWVCFKRSWLIMIVAALLAAILAGAFISIFVPKEYTSTIKFYARNSDNSSDYVSQNSLGAMEQLINDYVSILGSEKVLVQIKEELKNTYGRELSTGQIKSMISASTSTSSSVFKIIVTAKEDSKLAHEVALAIETVAPEAVTEIAKEGYLTTDYIAAQCVEVVRRMGKVEGLDFMFNDNGNINLIVQAAIDDAAAANPTDTKLSGLTPETVIAVMNELGEKDALTWSIIESDNFEELVTKYLNEETRLLESTTLCFTSIESPTEASTHSSPDTFKLSLIVGAAAAAVVYVVIFIRNLLEMTISSEEDLKACVDCPIIGAIPTWNENTKATNKK